MSFLKEQHSYVLVHTNDMAVAKVSGVYAVIQICFGSNEDSISIPFMKISHEERGFQVPVTVISIEKRIERKRFMQGSLWMDLVTIANESMHLIRERFGGVVTPGRTYWVGRDTEGNPMAELEVEGVAYAGTFDGGSPVGMAGQGQD